MTKSSKRILIQIIAVSEIVGGVSGIVLMVWAQVITPFNLYFSSILLFLIALYCLSIAAGWGLWKGSSFGRKASIFIQILQLVKISFPPVVFMFSSGLDFWIYYFVQGSHTSYGFHSSFLAFGQVFFSPKGAATGIGISLSSWVFLPIISRYGGIPEPQDDAQQEPPPPPDSFEPLVNSRTGSDSDERDP